MEQGDVMRYGAEGVVQWKTKRTQGTDFQDTILFLGGKCKGGDDAIGSWV